MEMVLSVSVEQSGCLSRSGHSSAPVRRQANTQCLHASGGSAAGGLFPSCQRRGDEFHLCSGEDGPKQHLKVSVAFPEGLDERFQYNELAAGECEPARLGFLPHRGQQLAVWLNAVHAVDDRMGIDVDRPGSG